MNNSYIKDVSRLAFVSLGTAGMAWGTSNWVERFFIGGFITLAIVITFLLDSNDPRNKARARRLLELEHELADFLVNEAPKIFANNQKLAKTTEQLQKSYKQGKKASGIDLEDLFPEETPVAPSATPAVNGLPPQE